MNCSIRVIAIVLLMVGICSCLRNVPNWDQGRIVSQENICIHSFDADTIYCDGANSSLLGQWLLVDNALYFFDDCIVSAKKYSLDGHLLGDYLNQGRGPDEIASPAWISAYDREKNLFLIHDGGSGFLHYYDTLFVRKWRSHSSLYQMGSGKSYNYLLIHPDPELFDIYEYNFDCNRMVSQSGEMIMPVVSDHVYFNKYYPRAHNKRYYRKAHILVLGKREGKKMEMSVFGNYPPIYKSGGLTMFSEYDFSLDQDTVFVSFAADPSIYKIGKDGAVLGSFGLAEPSIEGQYPPVNSIEEYEREYRVQRRRYGYYNRLFVSDKYVFRTCKLDGEKQEWILQIYDRDKYGLIGRISLTCPGEILGVNGGCYYAFIGEDLDKEQFKLIKFSL